MKKSLVLVPALLACLLSSCASIMTGSSDSVMVNSIPSGAYFTTNVGISGRTPKVVQVPASQDLIVEARREGYEPATVVVESRMSGWIAGNLLLGGIIGIVVDIVNPDARTHDSTVTVQLAKKMEEEGLLGEDQELTEAPQIQRTSIRALPREIEIRN